MTTDKQAPEDTVPLSTALRRFLDAAGGEGLVLDGVDAGDLYVSLYGYEPPPKPAMIAGTRIFVSAIQSFHKAGYDTAGILAEYPDLTEADVKAALAAQPAPAVPRQPVSDKGDGMLHDSVHIELGPKRPATVVRAAPAVPPAPEAPSTEAALREALEKISALDPAKDSVKGFNEWGEADCFAQAQNIAHDALAAPAAQPVPAVPLADDDDYSIANCIAWLDAKYRRHGEYEDKAAAEHLRRAAPPPEPAAGEDRRDAERWRRIRSLPSIYSIAGLFDKTFRIEPDKFLTTWALLDSFKEGDDLDAAIDAAMSALKGAAS